MKHFALPFLFSCKYEVVDSSLELGDVLFKPVSTTLGVAPGIPVPFNIDAVNMALHRKPCVEMNTRVPLGCRHLGGGIGTLMLNTPTVVEVCAGILIVSMCSSDAMTCFGGSQGPMSTL